VTPDELRAELDAGTLRSAYLLAGGEPLLRDDSLAAIRRAALGDATPDFDLDRLDGGRIHAATLLDSVGTLPVVAQRRLIVLREPEPQRGAGRGVAEALAGVVAELGEQQHAVLVVVTARADRRSRWVKAFGEATVDCDAPRGARPLVAFVRGEAQRQEVKLEAGAAELLAERIGPQLLMLRQEIAKAALLAGPGSPVTRAHVSAGASDLAEEPVWDLTDAIGEGRGADALTVLARLLRTGSAPPAVLGALVSHFRRLLRVRCGAGVSGPPFVRRKLEGQARRYTEGRLVACLRAIHQTDTALKGAGGLRPELALERLVIGLVG